MDKIQGEVVCSDCGLVLKEDILSYKPEWRAHTLAEYKNKTRTGIPIRYSKYDKGLSTSISGFRDSAGNSLSSKTKRKIWRLRKWQLRARDSKTGNLLKAMNKLQLLTENLHVSNTVQEKAAIIYRKALEKNLIQGRTIAGLVAGSMYVACRFTKTPKTINDIVKASNLSRRKISRAYRLIIQKLKIKMPPHDPLGYISRVAENTNISGEIQGISIRLLHQARHQRITLGKDPLGLVAALLYIACQLKNDPTTQKDIAEAAGITEVTLRNRKKDIVKKLGLKNIGS
jgi:transcription initiation factor TFIIB